MGGDGIEEDKKGPQPPPPPPPLQPQPPLTWVPIFRGRNGGGGCIRREGTLAAPPEVVGQAVGGGCQSGWGQLLSVTNANETGAWRPGDSGWA